jgi:F-type H+-transporting ATPase subunit b
MEVLNNIGFDWQVALVNFVSFLLIFFILKKWVFGPVGEILTQRKETIQEGVAKAERSEEELKAAQEQGKQIISDSRAEANQIVAEAKQHGDELIEKATTKAEQEAQKVTQKAQESIEKEKQDMQRELLSETAQLVSLGVAKLLEEEVDEKKHQELTSRALKDLSTQNN